MIKRIFFNTLFMAIVALMLFGFAGSALADKNYNSSISNTKSLQVNQEIGDILLPHGLKDTEINQVTGHLNQGISQDDLQTLLREMGLKDADIKEALTKFDRIGIKIDAKLLPTSRWYFLKEWWRGIRRVFTFNKIVKAELELRITNEKAAELLQVQEVKPDDVDALAKALANYTNNHERLKKRLTALKEASENPKVAELRQKVDEKTAAHALLMDSVEQTIRKRPGLTKYENIIPAIQSAREKIQETTSAAAPPPSFLSLICQPGWHEFLAGIDDQFALPTEPAIPSPGLQLHMNQYQGQSHRDFDEAGKNKVLGHTFTGVAPNPDLGTVEEAILELRIKPTPRTGNTYYGSPGIPETDSMSLLFFDDSGNTLTTGWSRRFGLDTATNTPGLFPGKWHKNHPTELLQLDLGDLPNADGSARSLIQTLAAHDFLDVYVQDDTVVDYLKLRVRHSCTPWIKITEPIEEFCAEDLWRCSGWSACTPAGIQTRTCRLVTDCPFAQTPKPLESQTCEPPPPSCSSANQSCGGGLPSCCEGLTCEPSFGAYGACHVPPPQESSDLKVEKFLGSEFHFGESASYTIQVENVGNGTATGQIIVTDRLPDGLTYISFYSYPSSDWSCGASGQKVTCVYTGPELAPGGFLPTLIINVTIAKTDDFPAAGDQVINCATVEHPDDIKPDNNSDCITSIITVP